MKNPKSKITKFTRIKPLINRENIYSLKTPLIIKKNDKRYNRIVNRLKMTGVSDDETWSLFSAISLFLVPRLKRFREVHGDMWMDLDSEETDAVIDKMIYTFELIRDMDEWSIDVGSEETSIRYVKIEEGLDLFRKYFFDLWW